MYIYVYIKLHIRYARSGLAVVVFFIVKSENKRSPGTDFAAEDMKENIQAIFVYITCKFSNKNRIFVQSLLCKPFLVLPVFACGQFTAGLQHLH